jgi:hypothetical protein
MTKGTEPRIQETELRVLSDRELDHVHGGGVRKAGPNNFIYHGDETQGPADKKIHTGR